MEPERSLVRIGRVVKPHGIGGELVVEAAGESLAAVTPGARLQVEGRSGDTQLLAARPHAGRWLLRLEGVADRNAAEELRGAWIATTGELPEVGPGEAYVDDLLGCRLFDGDELVGEIVAVVPSGAHDLLEVETGNEQNLLVPMVAEWLVELDVRGRKISMRLPDGLR